MGERVSSAQNEVGRIDGAEVVYCAYDGEPEEEYGGPQGYAPVEYAEQNWIDVDGQLCCTIYCAAKVGGLTEEQAQLARAAKTQRDLRADGQPEIADADEAYVATLSSENGLPREERSQPLAGYLEEVADEDTHEHELTFEAPDADDTQAAADEILGGLRKGGGE